MKTTRALLHACALAALALAAACESPQVRAPRTTLTVELTPGKPVPEQKIETVTAIRLVLPGPDAGSDLAWVLASNTSRVLDQMGPVKSVPAAAGGQASTEMTFYALEPGKSVLRFFLLHPSEKEATPVSSCEVTVRVDDD
jgi:hypothetical protein